MWPSDYTMTIFCEALVVFLLVPVLDALAIQPAQAINQPNLNLLVPQPLSTGSSALQVKTSSQLNAAFNASSKAFFRGERTDCNAAFYGVPAISSCLDVYKQMTDSDKVSVFGDRTRGIFEYPLPYRFTSSDGTCVIDIENLPWAYKDKATMSQMRDAALELVNKCVFGKHSGGITTGLGQQGNLAITVNTYKPDVECQPAATKYPNTRECKRLLSMMPTSTDEQVFGDKDDPGVEVPLPFDLVGPAGTCAFYFTYHGGLQRRSWHDLWEAAIAIWGMCGKNHEQGYAFVGNEKLSINIAMYRPSESLAADNSTIEGLLSSHREGATATA